MQAHEIQLPEIAAVLTFSQQLRTESCVVAGNGHCEAGRCEPTKTPERMVADNQTYKMVAKLRISKETYALDF